MDPCERQVHVLGLLLEMEIYDIQGPRCLYWLESEHLPSMRFDEIYNEH